MEKKINKRKIIILIAVVMAVVIGILAFGLSRARMIQEITINVIDYDGLLGNEEGTLNAINSEESGYYIVLPEIINDKGISKYIIQTSTIQGTENSETEKDVREVIPGTRVYLTDEEFSNKNMTLTVIYDKRPIAEEEFLYYKRIIAIVNGEEIIARGYMPINTKIVPLEVDEDGVTDAIILQADTTEVQIAGIYGIKLVSNGEEYNFSEYGEDIRISISGIEADKTYVLLSVEKEIIEIEVDEELEEEITYTIEMLEDVEQREEEIIFAISQLSIFAVLEIEVDDYMEVMSLFGIVRN